MFKQCPTLPSQFPLTPKDIKPLVSNHYKGDLQRFLSDLTKVPQESKYKRLTVILINHGDSQDSFGSSLEQEDIFNALNIQTKPTLVICSACYGKAVLSAEHKDVQLFILFVANFIE